MSKIDKLEKLARLKEKGILTKKEFEIEKKAILVKYEDDEEEDCGVDGNSHQNSAWGYFLDSFKKGPSGRATRSEFWSFGVLFCFLLYFVWQYRWGPFSYWMPDLWELILLSHCL